MKTVNSLLSFHKNADFTSLQGGFFDCIVITASNNNQAKSFNEQINNCKKYNRILEHTEVLIIPDKDNKRVGSGGSTLSVIKKLKEKYKTFNNKKFLVIHAGGDSKRCPQYSALGKIFSPIPYELNGKPATLFDFLLMSVSEIPLKMKEGMFLLSGDVILIFNALMCDFGSNDAAVISFKEDANTAKNHGVFVSGNNNFVKKFLHKQTIEKLSEEKAIDENNNCNIDTGAIWLSKTILNKLENLVHDDSDYDEIVNDKVRLSLYGDIEYCLAEDSTLDNYYLEKPEGVFCEELKLAREKLWRAISQYKAKLISLVPAKFVHFGSVKEIMSLMNGGVKEYEPLDWSNHVCSSIQRSDIGAYNSVLSKKAIIGSNVYLENSYIHEDVSIGDNCYLSCVEIDNAEIPQNLLIHCLTQNNGKYVCRIIGINDNPKDNNLFGMNIDELIRKYQLKNVFNDDAHSLWNANLFEECDTMKEALESSLKTYGLLVKDKKIDLNWKNRKSLFSSFNDADSSEIIKWNERISDLVIMEQLDRCIKDNYSVVEVKNKISIERLTENQLEWINKTVTKLNTNKLEDFSYMMRLYYYLGFILNEQEYISKCFDLIAEVILKSTINNLEYNDKCSIAHKETVVKLPLRVNFGGGWSDTPPHCLERGGIVLNAAINLNGELPVEVKLVKITEKKVIFDSRDMDVHGEFDSIEELQKVGDPSDPFALQKACLLACGIIPKQGGNLKEILDRLSGGFEMHSEVRNVPKGSGLGTSSILSAASVKAVFDFMDIKYNEKKLCSTVLAMEQIMSTGGGWQDQIGGISNGFKYITSKPGIDQKINIQHISLSEKMKKEFSNRFCIIYTGQRRLARNLLRDVVGRYVGNIKESIETHEEIQIVATKMKEALESENFDEFAKLLDYHWRLSKQIDEGSSNALIEQIFNSIDDLIDARMVIGAGGGGFLQVILKRGTDRKQIHNRLKEVFEDASIDVYESEFVF